MVLRSIFCHRSHVRQSASRRLWRLDHRKCLLHARMRSKHGACGALGIAERTDMRRTCVRMVRAVCASPSRRARLVRARVRAVHMHTGVTQWRSAIWWRIV